MWFRNELSSLAEVSLYFFTTYSNHLTCFRSDWRIIGRGRDVKNPENQAAFEQISVVAPNICGSKGGNLLHVTSMVRRILLWLLDFWKTCTSLYRSAFKSQKWLSSVCCLLYNSRQSTLRWAVTAVKLPLTQWPTMSLHCPKRFNKLRYSLKCYPLRSIKARPE